MFDTGEPQLCHACGGFDDSPIVAIYREIVTIKAKDGSITREVLELHADTGHETRRPWTEGEEVRSEYRPPAWKRGFSRHGMLGGADANATVIELP